MSKVLFFARDPGGANCIIPVIQKAEKNFDIIVLAKDVALERIKSRGIPVEDIGIKCNPSEMGAIEAYLRNSTFDAVITGTSVDDFTERYLWKACETVGIPAVAIVDQWTNLGIRFSKYNYLQEEVYKNDLSHDYLPSVICVMDELAKQMMIRDGIPEDMVFITGQPHFDTVKMDFERTIAVEPHDLVITFVSEPIFRDYDNYGRVNYWGFNEVSVFSELINALKKERSLCREGIRVVVRPHPRDDLQEWENRIKCIREIPISIDANSNTYQLLKESSLVCGMSSMMLLEAAICGVPIISVMIGLKRENPFVLSNIGICPTITNRGDLQSEIRAFFCGDLKKRTRFSYIENATDHVITCINEVVQNGSFGY